MDFSYDILNNDQGFVNRTLIPEVIQQDVGLSSTDIMIGKRKLEIFENSIRGQFIFTNRQSLSLRIRHYNATVIYNSLGILDQDGSISDLYFDGLNEEENPIFDRNFNAFTVDMNYLWRFAPGSDVILNFKSEISGEDDGYDSSYLENIGGVFDQYQENSLSLRIVYYLDYLYFK